MVNGRWERLREDPHLLEVARGTVLALLLQVVGSGLSFGFHVAVARLIGARGAGIYFLALSVSTIGSIVSRIGLDNTLLRFVATKYSQQDGPAVKGIYRSGMSAALVTSVAVSALLFAAAGWMSNVLFHKPDLTGPLRWMTLSILPFTLLNLQAECLKGVKLIPEGMILQASGVPFVALLLIVPFAAAAQAEGVSAAYLIATWVVAVLGLWRWRHVLSNFNGEIKPVPFRDLWESCKMLFGVTLINRAVLPWAPLFILGIWASNAEVGIFGAASRLSILVSIILIPANNVLGPKFAELYVKEDMKGLETVARRSTILTTLIASPLFVVLLFAPNRVMALFGPEFQAGGLVLAILAVGQLFNACTGSVGFVLMMGGHEAATWKAMFFAMVTSLAGCMLLAPRFGAPGCAMGVMLAEVLKNVLLVKFCKRRIGIMPVPLLPRLTGR